MHSEGPVPSAVKTICPMSKEDPVLVKKLKGHKSYQNATMMVHA